MRRSNRALLPGGLAVALLVVALLAPNASGSPDGLERVAQEEGFAERAADAPFGALPGYAIPGLGGGALSTILAGALGTLAAAALALLAARGLRARSRRGAGGAPAGPPRAGAP